MQHQSSLSDRKKREHQRKQFQVAHDHDESRWAELHEKAFVGDVHAHPGLPVAYFNRRFVPKARFLNDLLAFLLPFDPLGFDPLIFRTEFESLTLGGVNLVMSTVVLPEREGMQDVNKKAKGFNGRWIFVWWVVINSVLFAALQKSVIDTDFTSWLIRISALLSAVILNYVLAQFLNLVNPNSKLLLLRVLSTLSGWKFLTKTAYYEDPLQDNKKLPRRPNRYVDYSQGTLDMIRLTRDQVEKDGKGEYEGKFRVAGSSAEFEAAVGDIEAGSLQTVFVHAIEGAYSLEGEVTYEIIEHARAETDADKRPHHSHWKQISKMDYVRDVMLYGQEVDLIRQEVLNNLYKFRDAGLAVLGLGHYHPNVVCDVVFPYPAHQLSGEFINLDRWPWFYRDTTRGLTVIGQDVIREAQHLGIIIDLTHASPTTRKDVYELLDREFPDKRSTVIASHAAAYALNPLAYCLKDWEIRWLARREGLIGVMLSNYFLTGHANVKLGLRHVANHIAHIRKVAAEVVGEEAACDVIGIGTDFDGFSEPPDDFAFSSQWPRITQRLLAEYDMDDKGRIYSVYDPDEIRKILGGNLQRVLLKGWVENQQSHQTGAQFDGSSADSITEAN